jgi:hypothetical protein
VPCASSAAEGPLRGSLRGSAIWRDSCWTRPFLLPLTRSLPREGRTTTSRRDSGATAAPPLRGTTACSLNNFAIPHGLPALSPARLTTPTYVDPSARETALRRHQLAVHSSTAARHLGMLGLRHRPKKPRNRGHSLHVIQPLPLASSFLYSASLRAVSRVVQVAAGTPMQRYTIAQPLSQANCSTKKSDNLPFQFTVAAL